MSEGTDLGGMFYSITGDMSPLKGVLGSLTGLAGGLGGALTAALGPIAALLGSALAIGHAIKAFAEADSIEKGLLQALKNTGQEAEKTLATLKTFATQLSFITTLEDDAALDLAKYATNLGLTGKNLQDVIKAAVGLNQAFGTDMRAAIKGISLEQNGYTSALTRQIPALKGVTDSHQRLKIISDAASKGFEEAKDHAKGAQGTWVRFTNAVGNLSEAIGSLIAGPGTGLLDQLTMLIEWIASGIASVSEITNSFDGWGDAMGRILSGLFTFGIPFGKLKNLIADTIDAIGFLSTNWGICIDAMLEDVSNLVTKSLAYISWFGTAFSQTVAWFFGNLHLFAYDAINLVDTMFSNLFKNITKGFTALWAFISSGGTAGFKPDFNSLTEGYKSALSKLTVDDFVPPDLMTAANEKLSDAFKDFKAQSKNAVSALDKTKGDIADSKIDLNLKGENQSESKFTDLVGIFKSINEGKKDENAEKALGLQEEQLEVARMQLEISKQGSPAVFV